ncbi:MAG TPA: translation elongation factor Ts [Steroidobacteraceae bacterium]
MAITAEAVKQLRERTGAGMMECKKALVEVGGDLDAAAELMRKQGLAKADKKAARVAAEGIIVIERAANGLSAAIAEINCETDFVAREQEFRQFGAEVAQLALEHRLAAPEAILGLKLRSGEAVDERRRALITKIGENINVRRIGYISAPTALGAYVHTGDRVGALVALKGGNEVLARELAMHVAWFNPPYATAAQVPAEQVTKEREILAEQARNEGKPPEIVAKMIEGRLRKYLNEITLLGQAFVKDQDVSVEKLLKNAGADVVGYVRFEVGAGIERKQGDFAAEVMATVKGATTAKH